MTLRTYIRAYPGTAVCMGLSLGITVGIVGLGLWHHNVLALALGSIAGMAVGGVIAVVVAAS